MDSRTITSLVILSSFLATVSATDIFLPSLPGMANYFGSDAGTLQSTISVYLFAQLFAASIWGTLSDHFGRQKMLFLGMSVFLVGTALCAISVSVPMLIAARMLQGAGAVACPIIGWATLSDLYPKDESVRVMSWMGGVMTIAPLIAPMIGGLIDEAFGWRANFFVIIAIAACSLTFIGFGRFEQTGREKVSSFRLLGTLNGYLDVISNRRLVGYVLVFAFLSAGEFTYLTVAPFYLTSAHAYAANEIGFFISVAASAYVLGAFGASKIARLIGIDASLAAGILVAAFAGVILIFLPSLFENPTILFAISASLFLFGSALVWGPSASRALQQVSTLQRGSASALRSLILTLVQFLGAGLGGVMQDSSLLPMGIVFLAFASCSMVSFIVARSGETKTPL